MILLTGIIGIWASKAKDDASSKEMGNQFTKNIILPKIQTTGLVNI
jgi:hypothetical protein